MSKVVDERVVQMQFDNSQFERNVSTSMSTLDKLKRSLNLSGAAKGLSELGNAAKGISMNGLGSAVDTVRTKFSALQVIGVTALANITNSAVNAGKRIVNALTLEPVMTGFQEYETQMGAIQTILANTQSKGSTLNDVNKALDELNHYADKTIYNFTEMTRNIGTFTAAGIDLKTSVSAIQGIANLAAVSGSTSQQASTAMYQLSQALAAGTVKLMDWNSVVNAGMGGEIFQNALKKTSEELKTGAEAAIKAKGSFRESLSEGWLTSQVLTETLKKFTTSGANEYVAEYTGLSVDAIQAALDSAKAQYGEADAISYAAKALAEKSGKNEQEIKDALNMAKTAEDAATKVRTFAQLWDTLKEAAQSGWTSTWQIIVGDFEEATDFLTRLSEGIGSFLQGMSDARNKYLSEGLSSGWKQLLNLGIGDEEGYKESIKSVAKEHGVAFDQMITDEGSFSKALKKGLTEGTITSGMLSESVTSLADKIRGMSQEERAASGYTSEMLSTLEKLESGLKDGSISMDEFASKIIKPSGRENLIDALFNSANAFMSIVKPIKEAFLEIFPTDDLGSRIYDFTTRLKDFTAGLSLSGKAAEKVKSIFKNVFANLKLVKDAVGEGLTNAFKGIIAIAKPIKEAFSEVFEMMKPEDLAKITTAFSDFTKKFIISGETAAKLKDIFKDVFTNVDVLRKAIGEGLINVFKGLLTIVKPIAKAFTEVFNTVDTSGVKKIADAFTNFTKKLILSEESADKVRRAFKGIFSVFDIFRKILGSVAQAIAKLFNADGVSSLGDLLLTAAASIGDFFTSLNQGFDESGLSGVLSRIVSGISSVISGATEHMSGFTDVLSFVGSTVAKVAGKIWESFKTVFGWISDNVSAGDIFAGLAGGGIFVTAKKLSGLIEKIKEAFDKLFGDKENGIKGKFADVMDSVHETLSTFQDGIKVSSIVAIAVAVGILSASMKAISDLDVGQITKSLLAIGAMLGMLSITMGSITKTLSGLGSVGLVKAGVSLVLVAAAVAILAGAMKKLADLSLGDIAKGLIALGGGLLELSLGLKIIDKTKIGLRTSIAMVALAASCSILADALKKFSELSMDEIGRGLVGMGGALAELVVAMSLLNKFGGGKSIFGSLGILIAVQSLSKMADGLKKFGQMSWDTIKRGLAAMGGALGELGIVLGLLGKLAGFPSIFAAGAILMVVQGLDDLAEALEKFGGMTWDEIGRGLAGMGGALLEVGAITGALGALTGFSGILGAGAILIVIQGLADLADAFKRFAGMTWDEIGRGLAGMGGALLEVGAITGALGALTGLSGLLGAGALLLAIQGLADLASAFKSFGTMSWDEIGRGLVGMGGALLEVAGITGALGALAGLPALLGSGAILLAVQGLGDLADALKKFGEMSWDEISRGLSAMGGALGELALGGVLNTLSGLGALSISAVAEPLGKLADSVKKWTGVTIPDGLGLRLAALATAISTFTFSGIGAASLAIAAEPLGTLADSVKKWTGVTIPDGLVEKMSTLASGIEKFTFAGLGAGALSAAAPGVGEMADSIKKWSTVTIPEGLEDGLKQIASGVKAFSFAFIGGWSLGAITGPLGDLAGSVKKWNGISVPDDLGDGLKRLASGIRSFTFAFVGGWSLGAITGPLGNLADSVKKWKGVSIPDDLGKDLKSLSDGVVAFSWAFIGGWSLGAITGPLGTLADSVKKWKNVSIPETLGDDLTRLANGVTAFSGVPDVSVAANGLQTISSAAKKLSETNFLSISSGMRSLTDSIKNMASIDSVSASLGKFGNELVNKIVTPIQNATGRFKNVGSSLSDALANGINSRLSAIVSKVREAMDKSINTITSKKDAFNSSGAAIITSFVSGISSKTSTITTAFTNALQSAVSSIKLQRSNFYNAGNYLVEGFANGISDNAFKAQAKAIAMANAALQAAEDALDENSPSKEAYKIGDYFGLGFVNAIGDYGQKAYKTSHEMADQARVGLSNAISQIKNKIDGDMDVQPTIRPVVDLANVKTGVAAISDMFGKNRSIDIGSNVSSVSSMMRRRGQNGNNDGIISAIDKVHKDLNGISRPSYSIGGITYDADSEVAEAIETLVRAAKIERRV